jgi:hypothetical protein
MATSVVSGTSEVTLFAWVYKDPWAPIQWSTYDAIGFSTSEDLRRIYTYMTADSDTDNLNAVNVGDYTIKRQNTLDSMDGVWMPICIILDSSSVAPRRIMKAFLGTNADDTGYSSITTARTCPQVFVGGTDGFNIAHLTMWDRALTLAEYTTLITPVGGKSPNPTTMQNADILSYWSFETDSLVADEGGDPMTLSGTGSSYSADTPLVDAYTGDVTVTFGGSTRLEWRDGTPITGEIEWTCYDGWDLGALANPVSGTTTITLATLTLDLGDGGTTGQKTLVLESVANNYLQCYEMTAV